MYNKPSFQEQGLTCLENYIEEHKLTIKPEEVMLHISSVINDDEWFDSEDEDIVIATAISAVPKSCRRVKKACRNNRYVLHVVGSHNGTPDGLFPLPIVTTMREFKSIDSYNAVDTKHSVRAIIERLVSVTGVTVDLAMDLLARSCGIETGKQLKRFIHELEVYLLEWSNLAGYIKLPKVAFKNAINITYEQLSNFKNHDQFTTNYQNDEISALIVNSEGSDIRAYTLLDACSITSNPKFGRMVDDHNGCFHANENINLKASDLFYKRLFNFTMPCNGKFSVDKMTSILHKSIYVEMFHLSVVLPVLTVNSDLNERHTHIEADEAQYYFYHCLTVGNSPYISDVDSKNHLNNYMRKIHNNFTPTKLNCAVYGLKNN